MVFLGTLAVPSGGASVNNDTTGTPFTISPTYRYLLVITPASTAAFDTIVATGSSLSSDASEYAIPAASQEQIACPPTSSKLTVIAMRNSDAGGSVQVFGLYGPAGN